MRLSRGVLFLVALAAAFSVSSATQADIMITISPAPGGASQAVGTGSGTVSGTTTSNDWDYNNFAGNFLAVGQDSANTTVVTGAFTNVTTGITYDLESFQLDEDGGNAPGSDDIDIDTLVDAVFTAGDEFTFTMTAEWPLVANDDAEGLPFSGLVPGTYTHPGGGVDGDEDIFGMVTIHVVPEPCTGLLAIVSSAGFLAARRFRR